RYFPDIPMNSRTLSFNPTDELLSFVIFWSESMHSHAIDIHNERQAILKLGLQPREHLISITFHPTDPDITLVRAKIYSQAEEAVNPYRAFIWDQQRQVRTELFEQIE